MKRHHEEQIAQKLVELGILKKQVLEINQRQMSPTLDLSLTRYLVVKGTIHWLDVEYAMSHCIPGFNPTNPLLHVKPEDVKSLPRELAHRFRIVPLDIKTRTFSNKPFQLRMNVATDNLDLDIDVANKVLSEHSLRIVTVNVSNSYDFEWALQSYFGKDLGRRLPGFRRLKLTC